ncbi:type VII secretion-associated serine protease mycosin [Streptomyces longwoodensis]|uniref:type VII secretion-associated serine protease mycosin n=1 Tax=Streptomyces longwoodensis TaxID=68231 RepID=UPI002ED26477|nr:type VII secretion-associated serine protease mycosin [Streptomyces longwoodensis]WUC71582.1 type VII secretion-associated serine protease mycosin [Streptomyces longwoodensis]
MRTSSVLHRGRRAAGVVALAALMLLGSGATPASAGSTRDKQWFLDAMQAEAMWQTSTGKGITVAVIDTGVDPDNPDLKGRVLDGRDFAPPSRSGDEHTDYNGHGTGMAGLIAGTGAYDGGNGAFGLAPEALILPVRMPDADDVSPFAVPAYFVKAIRYAADAGARVINISMTGGANSPDLAKAVAYALSKGSLVFAAAGNDAEQGTHIAYPAATPGVVGVAAVGKNLRRTAVSQYGPQVDMAAPGEDLVHACGGKTGLCETSGTSDATALASASAALIWSVHPDWTNNQVLRVMLNTLGAPTDGAKRNDSIGYGIVRPRIALANPGDPGPADVYPLPDLKAASPFAAAGGSAPSRDADATPKAGAAGKDDTALPWSAVGIGTAVLLLAAIAVLLLVARRRTAAVRPDQAALSGQISSAPPTFGPPPGAAGQLGPPEHGNRSS